MTILDFSKSDSLREKYIETFIKTETDYFKKRVKGLMEFSDGLCYTGYLWDCFKKSIVISENESKRLLKEKRCFYVMWDIHSSERILIPDYWKYPKNSILFVEVWNDDFEKTLPEDIYIFDDTFSWSIALTHETYYCDDRYCVYTHQ